MTVQQPGAHQAHAPAHPGAARRRDIQGLRAVAVLSVLAYHGGLPLPGGFTGVDVFFTISGFVITALLLRDVHAHGRLRLVHFYRRRVVRLLPALAVLVTVTMLGSVLLLSPLGPQRLAARTGIGAMLLAANEMVRRDLGGYFDVRADSNPLLHTWSLSVEEQFYLVFPALLGLALAGASHAAARRRAAVVLAAASALSLAVALLPALVTGVLPAVASHAPLLAGGFYSPVSRAWEFGVGALVALLGARPGRLLGRLSPALAVAGAAGVLAAVVLVDEQTRWPGPMTLLPTLGCAALILAGLDGSGRNPITRVLAGRPLVTVGDWSYSLYLWHWPLIVWAQAWFPASSVARPLAAALSVVPAVASYRLVEQPLRRATWPAPRFTVLVAAAVLPPLVAALALGAGTARHWRSGEVARLVASTQPGYVGRLAGCNRGVPLADPAGAGCVFGADAPGAPVYLLGDSQADQLSDPVVGAGRSLHRPVVVAATSGCPLVDAPVVARPELTPGQNARCRRYVHRTLAALTRVRPGLVVLANSDAYWYRDDFGVAGPTGTDTDPASRGHLLSDGLARTVRAARSAGHQVVIVQTVPQWVGQHAWNPLLCPTAKVITGRCAASMSVAEAAQVQGTARRASAGAAARFGAQTFDPWPLLCPEGVCRTRDGSRELYRDADHVTVDQARRLTPAITEALATAGRR